MKTWMEIEKKEKQNYKEEIRLKHFPDMSLEDFESIANHFLILHGISLKSERGKKLFEEIAIPEIQKGDKKFSQPGAKQEILSLYKDYNQAVMTQDSCEFASVLAQIYQTGLNPCLKPQTHPFEISKKFQNSLAEFLNTLQTKGVKESAIFFKHADIKNKYSAIELILIKNLHFAARKIFFLAQTDPELDPHTISEMHYKILVAIEEIQIMIKKIILETRPRRLKKFYKDILCLASAIH